MMTTLAFNELKTSVSRLLETRFYISRIGKKRFVAQKIRKHSLLVEYSSGPSNETQGSILLLLVYIIFYCFVLPTLEVLKDWIW